MRLKFKRWRRHKYSSFFLGLFWVRTNCMYYYYISGYYWFFSEWVNLNCYSHLYKCHCKFWLKNTYQYLLHNDKNNNIFNYCVVDFFSIPGFKKNSHINNYYYWHLYAIRIEVILLMCILFRLESMIYGIKCLIYHNAKPLVCHGT